LVPLETVSPLEVSSAKDRLQLRNERTKLQNDVRTTLLQGLGGAFFLATAFFTWRQVRLSQEQLQNAQEQLHNAKESQITERLTRAIDQLASKDKEVDISVGAIYSLERIAKDSPPDASSIHEVLSAYIRTRAKLPSDIESIEHSKEDEYGDTFLLYTRLPGVQAAMTALARPPLSLDSVPFLICLDFRVSDLEGAYLRRASLFGCHFELANLKKAQLQDSNLKNATLQFADLKDACLQGAKLNGANLENADLQRAHLEGAFVGGCNFRNAKGLDEAHLKGARADERTEWPEGFDWEAADVVSGEDGIADGPPKS
jgi:hypothetical protein